MTQIFKSSARIVKFKSLSQIHAMSSHSLRMDDASRRRLRPGAQPGKALHFSTMREEGATAADFTAMRDIDAAYKAHKKRHGIGETKNGGLGFHAIINVTPEWVNVAGDLHDPRNPRNGALFIQAMAWVESWAGPHSVYAARLDLDETGGAVVDVFVAPPRIDARSGKLKVATSKALTELRIKHGERMSYVAMQTDWSEWCQTNLDPAIQRGTPKTITKAEHLEVEEYKAAHTMARNKVDLILDEAEAEAAAIIRQADNDALSSYMSEMTEIEKERKALADERRLLDQKADDIRKASSIIMEQAAKIESERTALEELRRRFLDGMAKMRRLFALVKSIGMTAREREIVDQAVVEVNALAPASDDGMTI